MIENHRRQSSWHLGFLCNVYKVKVCCIRARFAVTSVDRMPLLFVGYELTNNTLTTIPVSDYFDCVTACLAEQRCCSVNFKPEGISICNLNKRCRRERQEDGCLKRSDHAVYYELSNTRGWDVVSEVNDGVNLKNMIDNCGEWGF